MSSSTVLRSLDDLQPVVVLVDLSEERRVRALDVGRGLAAQDRPDVGAPRVEGAGDVDQLAGDLPVQAVRAQLAAPADDVRPVLGDEHDLVGDRLEPLEQVVVLPAGCRAEHDPALVQGIDERPEVVVDRVVVVEQRAVHVAGDQPDVGDGVELEGLDGLGGGRGLGSGHPGILPPHLAHSPRHHARECCHHASPPRVPHPSPRTPRARPTPVASPAHHPPRLEDLG